MGEARAWAEIDLGAVAHNIGLLRKEAAPAEVLAVVKADGYGHGAVPVAGAALDAGATALGVAIAEEGTELREAGIGAPIVVLSEPRPGEFGECAAYGLEPTVYSVGGIEAAARAASTHRHQLRVHLKVDTGMHRVGADPADAVELADAVAAQPALVLASVFTHCAVADEPDDPFTGEQLGRFHDVLRALADHGHRPPLRHAANSAGALLHPTTRLDLVRCGISIYGIAPAPGLEARSAAIAELRPALSLKAAVSFVRDVAAGERVSYGLRHRFESDTVVATLPIGYADGVPRRLYELGTDVLLGGHRRPIVGVITMDQLLIDCGPVGEAPRPQPGDEAVLIGEQDGERVSADDWAARLGTIAYEIVCGIGPRIPRIYR
jgi:alanine racemase